MGVIFRSGGYIKHIYFGGRTIKDGEAAAIWDAKGIHKQIIGPKRVWLINSTIRFLTRHKVESHQYLRVSHRDGRVEHITGPAILYENPAYHDSVCVQDGYRLCSSSECVFTFTSTNATETQKNDSNILKVMKNEENDELEQPRVFPSTTENIVTKRIIHGPTLFVPGPCEHVHTFSWSTTPTTENDDGKKASFNILHMAGTSPLEATIPTVDGFSFDVSLIMSYEITSSDKVIEHQDPMKYLHNSLLFDSQTLGDSFSNETLKTKKEDVVSMLSDVSTYPSLMKTAHKCGIKIDSIQVTTIVLCSALCEQIDKEQSLSANIRSEVAKKTHSYKIREMELEDQRKRVEEEATLKRMQVMTNDKLDLESHRLKLAALERRIELEKHETEAKRDLEKVNEEAVMEFLTKMKLMGVDMTKFMTTYGGLSIADKVIVKSDVVKNSGGIKWQKI